MKLFPLLFLLCSIVSAQNLSPSDKLFDDSSVALVEIEVAQSALDFVYANPQSDSLHYSKVHFKNNYIDEIIDSVGFRIRGNTSRTSRKKSFKLSFNTFIRGRQFYGVDKLNLNGEHNDPSIARSKLSWDFFKKIGLISSRASYAAVYINGNYYGLYISVEQLDDEFVKKNFNDKSGNLWKCLWPANLEYWGSSPSVYKDASYGRRTYDLITNRAKDDYSQLARLINIINNTKASEFPDSIESIIEVPEVLKYFAANVLIGGWDAYRFLKNNYYLYYEPAMKKFHLIPYDYDNTFGVDFFDFDWAEINPYSYANIDNTPRPLSKRLLAVPQYRNLFSHYLKFYSERVFDISLWENKIDSLKSMIKSYARIDTFRTKDYGFSYADFLNSFSDRETAIGPAKRELKNFIVRRNETIRTQINFFNALPYVYAYNFYPKNPSRSDSVHFSASIFSNSELIKVVVLYEQGNRGSITEYPMEFNPSSGTASIENADRWTVTLPPYGDAGFASIKVFTMNANGLSQKYPRTKSIIAGNSSFSTGDIFINELLAINSTVNADSAGDYDDWIELYNRSDSTVNLSGKYLTDSPSNLIKWQFPDGSEISSGGFLLIWCDKDTAVTELHANFKLNGGGEFAALVDNDGSTILDSIYFGKQTTDISFGRFPDGSANKSFLQPSPGYPNLLTSTENRNLNPAEFSLQVYPNPFNPSTNINYVIIKSSNVQISVYDILGRKTAVLLDEYKQPGKYKIEFNGRELNSGVYFINFRSGKINRSVKVLLLK